MVQGTMSSAGKSLMVAALCRIFRQDGLRVAPFKTQNMALNSFATRDGREIGRAQAMQADAAEVDVTVEVNPILIKPEADSFAQIVVMGKPWARLPASEYMRRRNELWTIVTQALDALRAEYDVVVIEGAGSPAELNLRRGDLVNMAIAEYANAPVLLVGDINRGGIFAQLLGTHMLLEASERRRIKGFIVIKFRGEPRLFEDGVRILEERSGVPVVGVMPFIHDLRIADEDSAMLDEMPHELRTNGTLDIVVVRLPHMSNFDDFDPLRAESNAAEVRGLGLLPVVTTFAAEKLTVQATGHIMTDRGLFAGARGREVEGYEIHMGQASVQGDPLVHVIARGISAVEDVDGAVDASGWIAGTYFHGLFDRDGLRDTILTNLAARKHLTRTASMRFDGDAMYDHLAQVARRNLKMQVVNSLLVG